MTNWKRRLRKSFALCLAFLAVSSLEAQALFQLAQETGAQLWFDPYRDVAVLSNAERTLSLDPSTRLAVGGDKVFELSGVVEDHYGVSLDATDYGRLKGWLLGRTEDSPSLPAPSPPPGNHPFLKVLVLDPGHGGMDPGCMSTQVLDGKKVTLKEKDLTLAVVLELEKLLKAKYPEKIILLTRKDDSYPTLEDRVKLANSQKLKDQEGILFLSVHFNASVDKSAKGLEFWYVPQDFQRDVLAGRAISELPNDAVPIMNAWLDSEYKKESRDLATALSSALAAELGSDNPQRGLKENPWYVVRHTRMPAVLAEMGFLTNPEEASLLVDPEYLKKLARGLYNGIVSFVAKFEGGS